MKHFVSLVFLFLFAGFALATYPNGYRSLDGYYTYHDGYWYDGAGASYTRTRVDSGYWNCGRYYPTYYYQYSPYTAASASVSYSPGWKNKMLDLASQRMKIEGDMILGNLDHQAYLESAKALGLTSTFVSAGYGVVPQYGNHAYMPYANGHYAAPVVATGNTGYGYSFNSVAQAYNAVDMNALLQMTSQVTTQAQDLGGQANNGFQAIVKDFGANQARVAEIVSKGQAAVAMIQALNAGPVTVQTQGFSFKLGPNNTIIKDDTKVTPEAKADLKTQFEVMATAKCFACHGGAKTYGGWRVTDYYKMTPEEKQAKVWSLLTHADPNKRMPRSGPDGKQPGTPLTQDELRLFLLN